MEEHKSIVSSANTEIEDLMFVPMSLVRDLEKVRDQVRILEARHSLYANGQNENLLNGQIATYLIGTSAASFKQNPSRQADAIRGRNDLEGGMTSNILNVVEWYFRNPELRLQSKFLVSK